MSDYTRVVQAILSNYLPPSREQADNTRVPFSIFFETENSSFLTLTFKDDKVICYLLENESLAVKIVLFVSVSFLSIADDFLLQFQLL